MIVPGAPVYRQAAPRQRTRPLSSAWLTRRVTWLAALALVLLLAFGLRVYRLDGQSLWADEGASVVMTFRSGGEILEAAAGDIHPPLYYLLLRAWAELSGRSEFALRALSLFQGVLVVALTFVAGRLLLDRLAALAGAFFAAVSPLLIYYSQEARMYQQMALLGLLGVTLALRWWRGRPRRPPLLLPLLATLAFGAAILSQFFGAAALLGTSLAFVVLHPFPWRAGRRWLGWVGCCLGTGALVAPWLAYASGQLRSWEIAAEQLSPPEFALRVFRFFAYGVAWDQTVTGKTLALGVGLLLLACLWPLLGRPRGQRSRQFGAVVALALAAPLLLFLVALTRPVFHPKFLLVSLPAFCLLQGAAIAVAARLGQLVAGALPGHRLRPALAGALAALALLGAQEYAAGRALYAATVMPKYFRDDYRGLVRYLQLNAQPGDVIILNAPGQREIFDYYYRGSSPVIGLPVQRPPDDAHTVAELEQIIARSRRIWLVLWASEQADPRGVVEGWLNEHTFRAFNRWYGGVRLVQYVTPTPAPPPLEALAEPVEFERGIELVGFALAATTSRPGEAFQLTLVWRAQAPVAERYTVFTHLIDAAELIWGQRDAEPLSGRRPTDSWQPGETIVDRYGLPVLLGTPPGQYYLEVGLYRPEDGKRLRVLEQGQVVADRVILGTVTVERPERQPTVEQLAPEHPRLLSYGPLSLLGYDFHKLGAERGATDFASGDLAHLTLYWRAERQPTADVPLQIELRNDAGIASRTIIQPVTNGLAPLPSWQPGEVVRDQHKFALDVLPGRYRFFIRLGELPPLELGELTVR
ncbi:MAG: hypothetical protein KatS3mg061_2868 [Dehalococcoidia bacterium]|nr:MAG: hypothetical protein KatS3mg061_2868 [Dehalococcoidia bacterium]